VFYGCVLVCMYNEGDESHQLSGTWTVAAISQFKSLMQATCLAVSLCRTRAVCAPVDCRKCMK
jgi:hypothetical protein